MHQVDDLAIPRLIVVCAAEESGRILGRLWSSPLHSVVCIFRGVIGAELSRSLVDNDIRDRALQPLKTDLGV